MADSPELPDPLLLRTVDIVLANRQSLLPLTNQLVLQSSQESKREL